MGTVWLRKGDYASSGDIVGQSDTTEIAAISYVHGDSNCTVHNAHTASLDCGLWSYCLGDGDKTVCGQFAVRSSASRTSRWCSLL